jgi:pimeloyl-ACP methyl ester carboxylesterase
MAKRPHHRRSLLAFLTVGLVAAAVAAAPVGASTTVKDRPAPSGLPAFYSVPQPLEGKPGTLVKSQKVDAPSLHGTAYRVMYLSKALQGGAPVAVTGIVAVPDGPAPKGGFPVVTWAHGTNGMADECAPSLKPNANTKVANLLLDQGWIIASTDYRGEGTPGLMPYIAGEAEARDTIDIVRAAQDLPAAHASPTYLVWGHSQGGHSAVFAYHFAEDYAPDLKIKGVVAGAPPSQFNLLYTFLKSSPFRYYLLMATGGLNAAYGDRATPLDEILTPQGIAALADLETGCASDLSDKYGTADIATLTTGDPFSYPSWKTILTENDPQSFSTVTSTPLLMIQGGSDEQIPVASTKLLADHYCAIGQGLERWIYPGATHAGVIAVSTTDMIEWMKQRFDGDAAPGSFTPSGVSGIEVTGCPA